MKSIIKLIFLFFVFLISFQAISDGKLANSRGQSIHQSMVFFGDRGTKDNLLDFEIIPNSSNPKNMAPDIIETIELPGGQVIDFINETDGVGVIETGPVSSPRVIAQLVAEERVTPLEIYERLTRNSPPLELISNHYQMIETLGRKQSDVKKLDFDISIIPSALSDGDLKDTNECNYNQAFIGNSKWAQDWYFEHGETDQRAQETYNYFEMQPGNKYVWSAGYSDQRWLGACNGDRLATPSPSFNFFPEYKDGNGNWTWDWNKQVDYWHKVT